MCVRKMHDGREDGHTGLGGIAACGRMARDDRCEGQGTVTCAPDNHASEEDTMSTGTTRLVALFVEKSLQQWVVRDPEGRFWLLPAVAEPWGQRQPFSPMRETELEPVPGHYTAMLGLPF